MSTSISATGNVYIRQDPDMNIQYSSDNSSWTTLSKQRPIGVSNTNLNINSILNLIFTTDIDVISHELGFFTNTHYITYDGSYNGNICTITLRGSAKSPGLKSTFHNKESIHTITIKNFIVRPPPSDGGYSGPFCHNFGQGTNNVPGFNPAVNYCTVENIVNYKSFSEGIVGEGAGTVGTLFVRNCINNANGFHNICGHGLASGGGTVVIENCINRGNVVGNTGGMCGYFAGENNGSVIIRNCVNNGNIISGSGIASQFFGFNTNRECSITNCYSTGSIGANSFGICGKDIGYNVGVTYLSNKIEISNCYSLGDISDTGGGLVGNIITASKNVPVVKIKNCYSYGKCKNNNGIININEPVYNITNCYAANGTWSDASANLLLTGAPVGFNKQGSTWASISANTPYILPTFNKNPIYSPSAFNNFVTSYTSGAGLFSPTDYSYNLISVDNMAPNASVSSITINQNNGVLQFDNVIKYAERIAKVAVTKGNAPYYTDYNFNTFAFSNICFLAKTPIKTDQGLIHIDEINPEIHTIRNKKIVDITRTISQDKHLICFEKDCLGNNIPSQKTIMSKNHEVFYKGKMLKAKEFLGLVDNVYTKKYNGEVLYNVLMEEHEKMVVNNLICETLHPNNRIAKLFMMLQKMSPENQEAFIKQFNEITENEDEIKKNMAIAKK